MLNPAEPYCVLLRIVMHQSKSPIVSIKAPTLRLHFCSISLLAIVRLVIPARSNACIIWPVKRSYRCCLLSRDRPSQ